MADFLQICSKRWGIGSWDYGTDRDFSILKGVGLFYGFMDFFVYNIGVYVGWLCWVCFSDIIFPLVYIYEQISTQYREHTSRDSDQKV